MTKNEFKQGDYVRMKSSGDICQIMCVGEKQIVLGLVGSQKCAFTSTVDNVECIDAKTAFLTELQALLRKYDARIYDGELYAIHIELGYHSAKSDQVDYLFYQSDNNDINADNIMNFNKE